MEKRDDISVTSTPRVTYAHSLDDKKGTKKIRKIKIKNKKNIGTVGTIKKTTPTATSLDTSNQMTPIFKNRDTVKPCIEEKLKKQELDEKRIELMEKKKKCEEELHGYIFKYFNNSQTLEDLLVSLYNLYRERKKKNALFTLKLREFIMLFPRDTTTQGYNFKRQHVFEQLCRLLLVFNYDTDYFGKNKEFYSSLEAYSKGMKNKQSKADILKSNINDASAAQSVDIFFKIPSSSQKPKDIQRCGKSKIAEYMSLQEKADKAGKSRDTYILIQNKFYDREYSSADKYDVTKIAHRAKDLSSDIFDNANHKIVLMVNNKQLLDEKIRRNRNDDFGLVSDIFGLDELEGWFQNMLYDLYKADSIDDFIKREHTDKPILQLRYHQELIVNSSNAYLEKKGDEHRKKFIWGCVPRSGKSYMVAGLVDKRKHLDNDILIILGAKSETETQFIEMFEMYENFSEYGIVTTPSTLTNERKKGKTKFIYLLSQEKIKVNKQETFTDKFIKDYDALFEKKQIDLYFDEIHKGGSTETSQNKLIQSLMDNSISIHLFVMVTATYARPTIAYEKIVTKHPPVILNWSYNDQQIMKEITNPDKFELFKNSRTTEVELRVIDELLEDYKIRYGDEYLIVLEEYYKKYPELVIINPCIETAPDNEKLFNIHGNVFRLSCSAMGKNVREIKDPSSIFEDNNAVADLLKFIGRIDADNTLPNDTLYGKMKSKYNYDVVNTLHSQLWFLPYSNLYTNAKQCAEQRGSDKKVVSQVTGYENEDETDNDGGLPNIEPLTRGLVLNLLSMPFYRDNFCFLVVHGQKIYDYYGKPVDKKDIYSPDACVRYTEDDKRRSVKDIIKSFEYETHSKNKSLIILTGSMLRLGISLPCVDIGLNFDNIMSIDLNYQTLFRVLTEREDKKYGYYVDFYPERATQFLYQYNDVYGGGMKKSKTMDELVVNLQSLLYLFNYNGISIARINEKQTLQLYNTLIKRLKLTRNDYAQRYMSDGANTIKKIVLAQGDMGLMEELKTIKITNVDKRKKGKVKHVLKKGKDKERAIVAEEMGSDAEAEEDEQDDEDDINIEERINMLYAIIAIVALFSDEKHYNCPTLVGCLEKLLNDVGQLDEFCNCNSDKIDVVGCYVKRIQNYTLDDYKSVIQTILKLLRNPKHETISNSLIIIFDNIREEIGMKGELIYSMDIKQIQDKIEEYLPVRKDEKNKYGEVFTPMSLIEEMLDKLPKTVWKNPNYKWLDPANGIGNFPMVAFMRLDAGLKDVDGFKDEKKRKAHIIKNMLYMVELNEKNVAVSRKIFGKEANIYCGSFLPEKDGPEKDLEVKWKKAFGVEKFDVIMGNPPYNEGGVSKGGGIFWKSFVFKSIDIINKNGLITFVHPLGWRKPVGERASAGDVFKIFKKGNLLYLNINDEKLKGFPTVDYYVWKNNTDYTKTTYFCKFKGNEYRGELYLNNLPFIPNLINDDVVSILNKMITKSKENTFDIIRVQSFKPTKDDMKKSGIPHTFYYVPDIDDYLRVFKKYEKIPEYINEQKVIMTYNSGKEKAKLYPKYYDKELGSTANTMYQIVSSKREAKRYIKLFNSNIINFLLLITQYSEPPNYKNEFKILNMIKKPNLDFRNENDIFNFFNINKKEILFINKILHKNNVSETKTTRKRAKSLPSKSPIKKKTRRHSIGGKRRNKRHTRKARRH